MSYPGVQPPRRGALEVVALVAVLGLSAFAAGLSPEGQNQVESAVRATVLYPFLQLHRFAAERGQVEERNRALMTERDSLTELVMRYRARPAAVETSPPDSAPPTRAVGFAMPAIVYPGRPYIGNRDVFFLTGPDFSTLEFPVGVFTGIGLVGVARTRHGTGASGEFWSHPDFRVSVVTEDGSVSGFVRAVRPEGEQPVLLLEGAPFQAAIAAGTLLVTTGIGAVYPHGVPVGWVREVSEPEAGWMQRYLVEPAVRPERISDVFVWERPELPVEGEVEPGARIGVDEPDTLSADR